VILRDTLLAILRDPLLPPTPAPEVQRELAARLPLRPRFATVLTGVRRCGKSTLQAQVMRRQADVRAGSLRRDAAGVAALYCNFEDTRLFGIAPDDFPTLLSLVDDLAPGRRPIFLDEVQAVAGWERLVRALVDSGRPVCVTGSNASLLRREVGARLTGRHLSFEVFPFSYREFLAATAAEPGAPSFGAYLDAGGFPAFVRDRDDLVLQELLRDIVERDVAARHRLRETRHLMNLALFLLANTGQPFSLQRLTKRLAVPTVPQTSRYIEFLTDAYLLFAVPRFSTSVGQRVVAPARYYAIDNGLRRAVATQLQPDVGHRLENAVALHLRRRGASCFYAMERDLWECDFVTDDEAIQVAAELTPANVRRELRGVVEASRLGSRRRARIVTLDQADRLREDGVSVEVTPAWRWMAGSTS
jgi:hypothetical protein